MHKTTIKINGAKLRELLENAANANIYEIAEANGFSRNIIANAVKLGYASSTVQGIARLYGIARADYEIIEFKHETETLTNTSGQISIDDLNTISREELKGLIKEAVFELFDKTRFCYDEKTHCLLIAIPYENLIITRENDLKEKSNGKNAAREVIEDFNKRFEI